MSKTSSLPACYQSFAFASPGALQRYNRVLARFTSIVVKLTFVSSLSISARMCFIKAHYPICKVTCRRPFGYLEDSGDELPYTGPTPSVCDCYVYFDRPDIRQTWCGICSDCKAVGAKPTYPGYWTEVRDDRCVEGRSDTHRWKDVRMVGADQTSRDLTEVLRIKEEAGAVIPPWQDALKSSPGPHKHEVVETRISEDTVMLSMTEAAKKEIRGATASDTRRKQAEREDSNEEKGRARGYRQHRGQRYQLDCSLDRPKQAVIAQYR